VLKVITEVGFPKERRKKPLSAENEILLLVASEGQNHEHANHRIERATLQRMCAFFDDIGGFHFFGKTYI